MAARAKKPSQQDRVDYRGENTYRAVFDRVADAIIIHAKDDHRILDVNPAALKRYGYSLAEMRQMTPFDLHPPEDLETVTENIDVRNPDAPNNYLHVNRSGDRIPVEILSDEIDYDGIPAWLSMVRDIRERRAFEQAISLARDEAIATSEHKSRFIADVSHELRTPMNGVIGMIDLLLSTSLDEEQREFAETIQNTAEVMVDLLNEILDLSKVEAGKLELESAPFQIRSALDGVMRMLAPRAAEAGIELRLSIDNAIPEELLGDAPRIRQVVTNLAGNAIKFTSKGYVAIDAQLVKRLDDGVALSISVQDTGIGIPEKRLNAIFESFTQAERTTAQRYGGTGLGLSISRELAELMGGRLRVESVEGEGSTFTFEFKVGVLERARSNGGEKPFSGDALIVHSDEGQRELHAHALRELGFGVCEASGSTELLELMAGDCGEVDLRVCFIEFALPDIDGLTLGQMLLRRGYIDPGRMLLLGKCGSIPSHKLSAMGFRGWSQELDAEELRASVELMEREGASRSVTPLARHSAPILVAEDNPVTQRIMSHLLGKLGYPVEIADDGREAVVMLQKKSYAMVFMDCQMPELDGYAATAAIRALNEPARSTPVVALTANAMDGDREKCLRAGMDDYLSKPASTAQIIEMIDRWCVKRSEARGPKPAKTH